MAQVRHVTQSLAVSGRLRTDFFPDDPKAPIADEALHAAAAKLAVGDHTWAYYGMSYGPPHIRAHKLALVDAEFRRVPGAQRVDPAALPADEYFWSRDRIAAGTPDLHELRWVNWMPNGAHVAFSPVSPIRGDDARWLYDMARRRHDEFGIDLFPAFCVGLREMHLIVEIVFDRADPGRRKAAVDCLRAMVADAAARGYGEYRTHLVLMDQVASTYSWNDGALMRFNNTLKDALDPNAFWPPAAAAFGPAATAAAAGR